MALSWAVKIDWAALSETVRPCVIFFGSNAIRIWPKSTPPGFTPFGSSRSFPTSRPSVRCSASMVCIPRLDAWYSARPDETRSSVTIRNPFSCFASTSTFSESITCGPAGTRVTRNDWLAYNASTTRAPNPLVVLSTSAMFRTAPPIDCTIWNTMMPPNSTGPRIADTQNHLVRTRSTNSRRITAQTLCTHPPIIAAGGCSGRRLWAHEIDENLMEGGSRQLKTRESRAGIDERLEDLLRVGARGELEVLKSLVDSGAR